MSMSEDSKDISRTSPISYIPVNGPFNVSSSGRFVASRMDGGEEELMVSIECYSDQALARRVQSL